MNFSRILILSPHTDDVELGCGGSMARWIEEGKAVFVAAFSTAEESLPTDMPPDTLKIEFHNSMDILGVSQDNRFVYNYPVRRLSYFRQEVLEELVRLKREIHPDLVIIPSVNDLHQDHQVVHLESIRAFKDRSVMAYELPWNHINFSAQGFVIIQEKHLLIKWQSLESYKSQLLLSRPYFSLEFIKNLATVRGTQINSRYAEAFEIVRLKYE